MSSTVHGRRIFVVIVFALGLLAVFGPTVTDRPSASPARPEERPALPAKFSGSDIVTDAIRSSSKSIVRINVKVPADREAAARLGRVVEDYGSFVIVAKDKGAAAKQFGLEGQELETTVNLPGASFEPLTDAPAGSLRLGRAATAPSDGYYVVQFGASATDGLVKSLRDAGVEVLQYVPHQAFFVYGSAEAIARVADHSRVRWIGQYLPEQKISSAIREQARAAAKSAVSKTRFGSIPLTQKGTAMFDVAVFSRADLSAVSERLQNEFGKGFLKVSELRENYFNLVRIELSPGDVDRVAATPDVFTIEPVFPAKNEDERAAQILAGNFINSTTLAGPGYDPLTQFGTDGTNIAVSVIDDGIGIPGDGGFYISSLNAVNGPLRGAGSGANGHGHLNATIIAGRLAPLAPLDPLGYNYGIGIAPKANIVSIPKNRPGYTGSDLEAYDDSLINPAPNGRPAFISNNSWGEEPPQGVSGNAYGAREALFDRIVRDGTIEGGVDPLTMVFSAGNSGASLTRPKAAKNLIVVGNSESIRTDKGGANANNMDDIAADSSRGPTVDGRIKPDVVAPGTAVTGGRSGVNSLFGNIDSAHRWSSGTSHSAAQISGVAALFSQWWWDRNFGDFPSPSLIKAALINAASDLNGENSTAPIPNGSEGWGRPNLKRMFTPGVGTKYIDESAQLYNTGDNYEFEGSVADGSKPVRVTLVWTDPPGTTDPALVNNLDLIVTVDGVEYKGNVMSGGVSVTGGIADVRNNVENVFLPAGVQTGSQLKVRVVATALNGDGILNNGDDFDQHYSVVVHNWSSQISPSFYNVSGRIASSSQRGVGYAKVRLSDGQGFSREVFSNPLGYFNFARIPAGQYTITVNSKRYAFTTRVETISQNISNLNFTSSSIAP